MDPAIEASTNALPIKLNVLQRTRARFRLLQAREQGQIGKESRELCQGLLQASMGRPPELDEDSATALRREQSECAFAEYIISHLRSVPESTIDQLLVKGQDEGEPPYKRLLRVTIQVIERFRNGSNFSIDGQHDGLVQHLIISAFFDQCCAVEMNHTARQLVFTLIGWTLMLYTPQPKYNDRVHLCIQNDAPSCLEVATQPIDTCEGSFLELVCGFGKVFPWKEYPRESSAPELSDQLSTASLNVSALINQFGITVRWVTCFSAHLDFDVPKRKLSIFCFPSFCILHEGGESALEHFLQNFHSVANRPSSFSVAQVMHETLLSYQLLFRNNPHARHNYAYKQRDNIKLVMPQGVEIDPALDRLCGYEQFKASLVDVPCKATFSKAVDFPVFAERLSELQDFIGKQPLSSLNALWNDHRDLNTLYTFRAVLVFGTIGVVIGLFGMALQAIQTAYTIMSYQVTK